MGHALETFRTRLSTRRNTVQGVSNPDARPGFELGSAFARDNLTDEIKWEIAGTVALNHVLSMCLLKRPNG